MSRAKIQRMLRSSPRCRRGWQERSIPAAGLLAQIIVSKYCDHLPLYRQEQIYWTRPPGLVAATKPGPLDGNGGRLVPAEFTSTSAPESWPEAMSRSMKRRCAISRRETARPRPATFGRPRVRAATPFTSGKSVALLHAWITSCQSILKGTVQCDGYAAYASFARHKEHIQLAACWAHAAGSFTKRVNKTRLSRAGSCTRSATSTAWNESFGTAGVVLNYGLQSALIRAPRLSATSSRPDPPENEETLPAPQRHGFGHRLHIKPVCPLLGVYLDDGRIEIDQTWSKTRSAPTALGKKNWLFIGEAEAGERSAILYTIVECCRRRRIDPFAYLRDTPHPIALRHQLADKGYHARSLGQRTSAASTTSSIELRLAIVSVVAHPTYDIYDASRSTGNRMSRRHPRGTLTPFLFPVLIGKS